MKHGFPFLPFGALREDITMVCFSCSNEIKAKAKGTVHLLCQFALERKQCHVKKTELYV